MRMAASILHNQSDLTGGLVIFAAQFDMAFLREFLSIFKNMSQDAVHGRRMGTHRKVIGHVGRESRLYPLVGMFSY